METHTKASSQNRKLYTYLHIHSSGLLDHVSQNLSANSPVEDSCKRQLQTHTDLSHELYNNQAHA